jgi:hypothetical protein
MKRNMTFAEIDVWRNEGPEDPEHLEVALKLMSARLPLTLVRSLTSYLLHLERRKADESRPAGEIKNPILDTPTVTWTVPKESCPVREERS